MDNDAIVRNVLYYIETLDDVEGTEVASVGKLSSQMSLKCLSHLRRSCGATKSLSVSSSSRRKQLLAAKLRREEVEKQDAALLFLAERKQYLEMKELIEKNRQKLVEAKIN